jgi:hypothetical protein
MQTSSCGTTATLRLKSVGAIFLTLSLALPAFATLGGNESSVEADRAQMKATVTMSKTNAYSVHEIKTNFGTVVREYVSAGGQVFGVAWQGPFIPDMQQLLGTYFQQYSTAAKAAREKARGRRPLDIHEQGLVMQSSGHLRAYWGRAFDPGLVPQGIKLEEIR